MAVAFGALAGAGLSLGADPAPWPPGGRLD